MDPSQYGAPAGWPRDMALDDLYDTATMRKNLIGAAFGDHLQHKTSASGSIPTPLSPDSETIHRPQHRYNVPMPRWTDGERPPTPPFHHQNDFPQYHGQWNTSLSMRSPLDHSPLPETQANYTSLYGTYTPAHDRLTGRPDFQSASSRQHTIQPPRLHPSANLLHSSPQQQITYLKPTLKAPSIQQWPTHNLASHDSKVDAATRKKQDEYRRKGEAARRKTISSQNSAPQYAPIPEPASTPRRKRKVGILDDLVTPTPAPHHRSLHPSYGQKQQSDTSGDVINYHSTPQEPLSYNMDWIGQEQYHTSIPPSHHPHSAGVFGAQLPLYPSQHPPHTPTPLPPSSLNIIDLETIPQHITRNYDEYRWPVKLYQLQAEKDFDFAECFLENHFQQNIYDSDEHKWRAHTTKGFIKDGDRLSILVLHNAANPFEWGMSPVSTTSIGVYGLYAHEHNEIHWTTIAPSIPEWFDSCSDRGYLTVKQKWHPDMKASEKRFHRAYWLAANMLPLNRILNNSLAPEKPHGLLEDDEGDSFVVTEEDLQYKWTEGTVTVENSEKIWQKLVDEVDALSLESLDFEHLATGGSERAFVVD